MHLYNFDTHNHKPGPIKNGQYYVKERGIIMIPEVPVRRKFERADSTVRKVLSIDFEADVYTIEMYSTVSIKRMLTTSKQLVKKLIDESWKIVK
mgnify:CR=1 FL=1